MKNLFFALCAIMLLPMAAAAQSITGSADFNGGPKLLQYQLPLDQSGSIDFARVSPFEMEKHAALPVAPTGDPEHARFINMADLDITPVGAPICLSADSDDIHLLQVGYGSGIPLTSKALVIQVIAAMELAAWQEGGRVEDAYTGKSG